LLSFYSQRLIITSSQAAFHRPASYGEMGVKAFGTYGRIYSEGCIILFQLGAQVSYLVIIGELLTPVLLKWGLPVFDQQQRYISLIVAAVIIFPLCSLRRMDTLRFTSFIALFFIFCLGVGVLVVSSKKLHDKGISDEFKWVGTFPGVFRSLPILNFAFTFHPSIPPVWSELHDKNTRNINWICFLSIFICGAFYTTLGLFGYLYYYNETPENILQGWENDYLFLVLRFGYSMVIIFSYPVLNFSTRNGIDSLLFKTEAPWWRHILESFLIVGVTYVINILVPSIVIIFGLIGATFGQLVIFINPALFYIFLYESVPYEEYNEKDGSMGNHSDSRRDLNWRFFCTPKKLAALTLVVTGIVCGVVSLIEIISGMIENPI